MVRYGKIMKTLKEHMKRYGLTARQVSEMTGTPLRTVHAHLAGDRKIGHHAAIRYSRGLGISLEKLLLEA